MTQDELKELNPICPLNLTLPTYQRVRKAVETMQAKTGYAIEPIGLAKMFYGYLESHCPSKMNKLKAKNMAKVFAVLLNEAFLCTSEYGGRTAKEWFYMTDARWEKHLLNKRNIQRYIKLLIHMKLIGRKVAEHPLKRGNFVTFYKIDPETVENFANEMYAKRNDNSKDAGKRPT